MTCWAVIPVKDPAKAKTRLAEVLTPDQRAALVKAMAAHVVEACDRTATIDLTCIVGSAMEYAAPVTLVKEPGGGLNAALQAALGHADAAGATRVVVIAGDLPLVTPAEIALLAATPANEIAIAPDRHGTGTNALSLPLPAARGFTFAFGTGSFARHRDEAARCGLAIEAIRSTGLARDIDEPADLADAAALLTRAG